MGGWSPHAHTIRKLTCRSKRDVTFPELEACCRCDDDASTLTALHGTDVSLLFGQSSDAEGQVWASQHRVFGFAVFMNLPLILRRSSIWIL